MIKIQNHQSELFAGVYWAISAREKKDQSHRGLDNIKIANEDKTTRFVGCDGHRLHIFKMETGTPADYMPGIYSVEKCTKSEIWLSLVIDEGATYPKYNSVIPSVQSVYKSAKMKNEKNCALNFGFVIRELSSDESVDFDFFKQIVAIDKSLIDFKVMFAKDKGDSYTKILIKKGGYFGIIMPLKERGELPTWQ